MRQMVRGGSRSVTGRGPGIIERPWWDLCEDVFAAPRRTVCGGGRSHTGPVSWCAVSLFLVPLKSPIFSCQSLCLPPLSLSPSPSFLLSLCLSLSLFLSLSLSLSPCLSLSPSLPPSPSFPTAASPHHTFYTKHTSITVTNSEHTHTVPTYLHRVRDTETQPTHSHTSRQPAPGDALCRQPSPHRGFPSLPYHPVPPPPPPFPLSLPTQPLFTPPRPLYAVVMTVPCRHGLPACGVVWYGVWCVPCAV